MYSVNGTVYQRTETAVIEQELPVGVYNLGQNHNGFFLTKINNFTFPSKIYGNPTKTVNRVLNTFKNQNGNLGILFAGEKGSGKTLTAQKICAESKLPVILINSPFCDETFKNFIGGFKQEVCLFFDEFEKVYAKNELQNTLLTILDGNIKNKMLILLTSNSSHISYLFHNRPSRVRYKFDYSNLDEELINDIIDDNLTNKSEKPGLINALSIISEVNIDTLMTIIKEMNLYNESAKECLKYLNIDITIGSWKVVYIYNNVQYEDYETRNMINPLVLSNFSTEPIIKRESSDDEDLDILEEEFWWENEKLDLTTFSIERKQNEVKFTKDGLTIVFTKYIPVTPNYRNFL